MPFATVENKKIYYTKQDAERSVEGRRQTCLMIHGLGSSSSFYAPIIQELVDAGYDCVAVDTEGSGLSKFSGSRQTSQTIVADFKAIMSQLSLNATSTILVAHSMGGIIACELAASETYAGVVLLGPVHPTEAVAGVFEKRIETVREHGMEAMADTIPKAATGPASTSLHKAFIRTLLLAQESDGYISLCNVIAQAQPPDYAKLKVPVLFIAGGDDKTSPMANVMKIHDSLGSRKDQKDVVSLEGVGHWHVIEAADAISRNIIDFIVSKV